jgi:hypothetical protein
MSVTGFHPLWDKILSQNLQAVADQECRLEGSSRGPLIGGYNVIYNHRSAHQYSLVVHEVNDAPMKANSIPQACPPEQPTQLRRHVVPNFWCQVDPLLQADIF